MVENKHKKTAGICAVVVCAMLLLSFASVPLYKIFCQVTGYGGTIQRADVVPSNILTDEITNEIIVRFDANISNKLNWQFRPLVREMKLKIGEQGEMFYRVKNLSQFASFGTATFNVTPQHAGQYFNKIECFCFTQQALAAGEEQDMGVAFFISPDILADPLLQGSNTITLSYTFFADDDLENEQISYNNSYNIRVENKQEK